MPRFLLFIYLVLLTTGSLLPSAGMSGGGWDAAITPELQNLLHVPAYAVLVVLALWAVIAAGVGRRSQVLACVGACLLWGASLEWLQAAVVPGRVGSVGDFVLNSVGILIGTIVWHVRTN